MFKTTKKNYSAIMLTVLLTFPFFTCKKFQTTIVTGKLINVAINKPMAGETMVLATVESGSVLIPEKANVAQTSLTDNSGSFSFNFEAYEPRINQRQPYYYVYWANLKEKRAPTRVENINLNEFYNTDLSYTKMITKLGETNQLDFYAAILGTLKVKCINELATPSITDTCEIRIINPLNDFLLGYHNGTGDRFIEYPEYRDIFYLPLITGSNTLRAIIKKNNQTIIKDTTFFAEDKEYYFEFRY
jgi:hypothetical protein